MKKIALIVILLLNLLPIEMQAQEKNIVGMWDFSNDRLLLEVTENTIGKYGEKKHDYKINGNEIVYKENERKTKFELRNDDTLMIVDGGEEHVATRLKINLDKNKKLPIGKYVLSGDESYIEILDEINIQLVYPTTTVPAKYLINKTKLYVVEAGYYTPFEINENASIKGLVEQMKDLVWEWVGEKKDARP